jgi:hypothetical protein
MEVAECVDVCCAMFEEGRIFDLEPNGTCTNALLHSLRGASKTVLLGPDQTGEIGWPSVQDVELMVVPVRHARSLFAVAKGFFELNFPD